MLDVSYKRDRRLASIEKLPKAVRALLMAKKALSRDSANSKLATFLSTTIRVIDRLQGIPETLNSLMRVSFV
jgi:hypothetical protein